MISSLRASHLKPKFYHTDNGDLFLQISVGGTTLSRPIPAMETIEEAEAYINKLVPDMAKELYQRRKNQRKRLRRSEDGRKD